jgi:endonuclease YncB( thermonuclease family)
MFGKDPDIFPITNFLSPHQSKASAAKATSLLKASGFLDIETTALERLAPIHQVAALFPGAKSVPYYEAVPIPFTSSQFSKYPGRSLAPPPSLSRDTDLGSVRIFGSWNQAFEGSDRAFHSKGIKATRLKQRKFEFRDEYITDLSNAPTINRIRDTTPLGALNDIFAIMEKEDRPIMWIANAQFEAGQFNAQLRLNYQAVAREMRRLMEEDNKFLAKNPHARPPNEAHINRLAIILGQESYGEKLPTLMGHQGHYSAKGSGRINDFLYVNHPEVLRARNVAQFTNDWSPVLKAIEEIDVEKLRATGGKIILDPFDIIKGVTSKASNILAANAYDTEALRAVTRGISLDFLASSLFNTSETHFGLEDNYLTAKIVPEFLSMSEELDSVQEKLKAASAGRSTPARISDISLSDGERRAIENVLKMGEIKKLTNPEYVKGAIDSVLSSELKARIEGRTFAHYGRGPFRTEWSVKELYDPSYNKGDKLRPERRMVPVVASDSIIYREKEEAIKAIRNIPGNEQVTEEQLFKMYEERKRDISDRRDTIPATYQKNSGFDTVTRTEEERMLILLEREREQKGIERRNLVKDNIQAINEAASIDKLKQLERPHPVPVPPFPQPKLSSGPDRITQFFDDNPSLKRPDPALLQQYRDWLVNEHEPKARSLWKPLEEPEGPPTYRDAIVKAAQAAQAPPPKVQSDLFERAATVAKGSKWAQAKGKGIMALMGASIFVKGMAALNDMANEKPYDPRFNYDTLGLSQERLDEQETEALNVEENQLEMGVPDGMDEKGIGATSRKAVTDFGSPYRIEEKQEDLPSFKTIALTYKEKVKQGMIEYVANFERATGAQPVFFEGMRVDQRIVDFQYSMLNTPFKKQQIAALMSAETEQSLAATYFMEKDQVETVEPGALSGQGISFNRSLYSYKVQSKREIEIEDADTVLIRNGPNNQAASFRLSGIDAPEIGHKGEAISSLRFEQNQPFGEEGRQRLQQIVREASDVRIVYDPRQETYGRALGVLMADGVNVNQQLVKEGWVKALPFGEKEDELIDRESIAAAENTAYARQIGMWQSDFWRTEKQLSSASYRMTNNTLTRLDKLAPSNTLGAAFTLMQARETDSNAYQEAYNPLKRRLAAMGVKKPPFKERVWRPSYYGDGEFSSSIRDKPPPESTPSYGLTNANRLQGSKSTSLIQSSLIDSSTYSNSIYSYRKQNILSRFEPRPPPRNQQPQSYNHEKQRDFHRAGQQTSLNVTQFQNSHLMMGG